MYFLLGNMHMEGSNYESAIDSFERARVQVRRYENQLPLVVSLVISLTGLMQCVGIPDHRF